MYIKVLKSKIHRATVTGNNLHYEGSIGIDKNLLNDAGLVPGEQVHVLSETTGERLVTYIIEEPKNSNSIIINGPAAHKIKTGEIVIILSYCDIHIDELTKHTPVIVHLDK